MENYFNKVFPCFDPLNPELFSSNRIINTFTNYFSFYLFNKHTSLNVKSHIQQLDNIALKSSDSSSFVLIIMDTSIKNNIAIFIIYIYVYDKPITKTLHYTLNIISTEAKLFSKIIVVMDSIYVVKRIFNLFSHIFQKQSVSILKDF